MGTFIFECVTVAWACGHYWRAFVIYFALSLSLVLVPAILTAVKSILWLHSYDIQRIRRQGTCLKRLNAVSIFLHLLSMGFIYRYVYMTIAIREANMIVMCSSRSCLFFCVCGTKRSLCLHYRFLEKVIGLLFVRVGVERGSQYGGVLRHTTHNNEAL